METQNAGRSSGILTALALCISLQMTGFVMILPLFARRFESFGTGVEALGMSAMAYALTSTSTAPLLGALADRFGRRPIILLSLTANGMVFGGYLLASSAGWLILLRGLAGIFTAGLLPPMMSMVGDLAPADRRGQWIGIVSGGASAGWIAGPLLGGALYDRFGFGMPCSVSIGMALAALLIAILFLPETHVPVRHVIATDRRNAVLSLPGRPILLLLLLIGFGVMFAWAFIEPQFMFYAYEQLDWGSYQLGVVMSMYGVTFMLGEFALGRLSDRLGRKPVLILGLVLFSSQFIGLVVFREAALIMVSFMLAGLGNALYDPALNALILDIAPAEYTARLMGIRSTAGSLGSLIGPALVVWFASRVSPQTIFLASAVLVCVLVLIAWIGLHLPKNLLTNRQTSKAAAGP